MTKERFEDAEIILMTDVFGDIAYLAPYSPSQNEEYRTALKSLSEDYPGCAYMDLTKPMERVHSKLQNAICGIQAGSRSWKLFGESFDRQNH